MSPASLPERADLVVLGGTIRTLDADAPRPDAMAVRGGRVLALGAGPDLVRRHEPSRVVDLQGATIVPGLVDAHAHLLGLGRWIDQVDLREARSLDDVIGLVKARAAGTPRGGFVLGRGWDQDAWPGRELPSHERLSAAVPDHPVLLRRKDGHATLANASALALARVDAGTPDPPGGEIVRDAAGRPTGVLVDAACELLPRPPEPSDADLERHALAAQDACLRWGLTGVHDAGVDERSLAALERLDADGRLRLRLHLMLEADFDGESPRPWLLRRLKEGPSASASGRIGVRAMKIFLDGALGSRGAALLEPYCDRPGWRGLLLLTREQLDARLRACRDAGFQAAVHAIGDAANRLVLDAFEAALGAGAASDHRWRVEHAQVLDAADLGRLAKLGAIASVQPCHATSDREMAEQRLGELRLRGAYAWRSLLRSGARLALGSDFPVESENPWWGLFAAVTRTDREGQPPGGWREEESLSRQEALHGFTLGAAHAAFRDGDLGSLSPGKRADFVVLPEDPLSCDARSLLSLRPLSTWIDGSPEWTR